MAKVLIGINIAENFNRPSRAHERYRRQTDRRRTGDIIASVSSRSIKKTRGWFFVVGVTLTDGLLVM